jgi:ribosomal protein L7/L12
MAVSNPIPTNGEPAKGVRGWLQRRAEALLSRPGRSVATLSEPGGSQVVLQVTGATPIKVVKVIAQATGLDLMSASSLARDAPVIVVTGISEASAHRVVERLENAGAKAVVGEPYRPEDAP